MDHQVTGDARESSGIGRQIGIEREKTPGAEKLLWVA
jgi:hypothetical protein